MDKIALLSCPPQNINFLGFLIEVRRHKNKLQLCIVHLAGKAFSCTYCIVLLNHHTASQSVRSHLVVQSFKSKVPP